MQTYYEAQSVNTKLIYEKKQLEKTRAELFAQWTHHAAVCPRQPRYDLAETGLGGMRANNVPSSYSAAVSQAEPGANFRRLLNSAASESASAAMGRVASILPSAASVDSLALTTRQRLQELEYGLSSSKTASGSLSPTVQHAGAAVRRDDVSQVKPNSTVDAIYDFETEESMSSTGSSSTSTSNSMKLDSALNGDEYSGIMRDMTDFKAESTTSSCMSSAEQARATAAAATAACSWTKSSGATDKSPSTAAAAHSYDEISSTSLLMTSLGGDHDQVPASAASGATSEQQGSMKETDTSSDGCGIISGRGTTLLNIDSGLVVVSQSGCAHDEAAAITSGGVGNVHLDQVSNSEDDVGSNSELLLQQSLHENCSVQVQLQSQMEGDGQDQIPIHVRNMILHN